MWGGHRAERRQKNAASLHSRTAPSASTMDLRKTQERPQISLPQGKTCAPQRSSKALSKPQRPGKVKPGENHHCSLATRQPSSTLGFQMSSFHEDTSDLILVSSGTQWAWPGYITQLSDKATSTEQLQSQLHLPRRAESL